MPEGVEDRDLRALKDELDALTERVVATETLLTQADHGTSELVASLRELSDGIRRQDKVLSLNSFVAYLIFTALLCAAFLFLYRGRTQEADAERDRAFVARDSAQARADSAARELAGRVAADRASSEVLEHLRRRRYAAAVAAHRKLAELELSAAQRQFLADAVDGARAELAADAALRARHGFDRRDYERARAAAAEGLLHAPEGAVAAELRYFLAASLDKLGRDGEAVAAYQAFLTAAPDHELARRARLRILRLAPETE
jgi:hypothetical protein